MEKDKNESDWMRLYKYIYTVMAIIIGNGIGGLSSNLGRSCLFYFTFLLCVCVCVCVRERERERERERVGVKKERKIEISVTDSFIPLYSIKNK